MEVDQTRVELRELLVAEPESLGDAAPKAVREEVGARDELVGNRLSLARAQVEGHAFLPERGAGRSELGPE